MKTIRYRVFQAPYLEPSLTVRDLQEKRRIEVEVFLNEIGVDRVISVTESGGNGDFAIVVWYREDGGTA